MKGIMIWITCTRSVKNTNRINLSVVYTLPGKDLLRNTKGLIIETFEITTLSYIANRSRNKITGWFTVENKTPKNNSDI